MSSSTPARFIARGLVYTALGVACAQRPAAPNRADAQLSVVLALGGAPIATIAIEVSAPDLVTPLVFNLEIVGGTASGTIAMPAGPSRTITARAFDAGGTVTHEGAITIDVLPGPNPAVSFPLLPRPGLVEVIVTVGSPIVTVEPPGATLAPGQKLQFAATVRDAAGNLLPGPVSWAVTPPDVASVSGTGLVTALAPGDAQVFAVYAGVAGTANVTVVPLPAAAAPTITPAGGVFATARTVTLATATPGAVIRYTLDGSPPTSAASSYATPFAVTGRTVVKAIAQAPGFSDSAVSTAVFVIEASGTLNGHTIVVDGGNLLLSWLPQDYAYAAIVQRTWASMLAFPRDARGVSLMWLYPYVFPGTHQVPNWPNAPGSSFAMLADSAILSYPFTGDLAVMAAVQAWLDHYLANGLTLATDTWASVPYNEGDPGSVTYRGAAEVFGSPGIGDGTGVLEPDKVAELGRAFLLWWEWSGNATYRDAAIRCADALVRNRRTTPTASASPWPFRAFAATGGVREAYTAHVIAPIRLFDELVRLGLGNTAGYQAARAAAWSWLLANPMVNGAWCQYFEDVGIMSGYDQNKNQLIPGNTARYLLERPDLDAQWESHARSLVAWIETNFGTPLVHGARPIAEQTTYFHEMGSHTSRYAAVNALLYERTGDPAAKENAFRALNWASYMNRADGDTIDGFPLPNQVWMTDGFGDYMRHFMIAMGAIPEWAPPGEDHLLRSTSVVQSVTYDRGRVAYRTFDSAATEVLRLTFTPVSVTADDASLPLRTDLAQQGWTWDGAARVLRVRHDLGRVILVR